ncbi:hypothetical protein EPIR_2057 [Erwinia piriflorinigrans CFBP 5888]|uniref:Uncharacterized protein n=1 Tax=Erwinia piriflorinigrans CFBP 5888 TaxID=1161919 RepID=V5Z7U3_9GAMM|nr:hypothetical protein EPIR_2057 [Erwinia piriflorinigrans CFBP 5888]
MCLPPETCVGMTSAQPVLLMRWCGSLKRLAGKAIIDTKP